MRKSVQTAILEALEGIREDLKGIRVALSEREKDFEKRHETHRLELVRHERMITDLKKVGGAR